MTFSREIINVPVETRKAKLLMGINSVDRLVIKLLIALIKVSMR
jgi:hypothetical protein